jgi:hypothetical protein
MKSILTKRKESVEKCSEIPVCPRCKKNMVLAPYKINMRPYDEEVHRHVDDWWEGICYPCYCMLFEVKYRQYVRDGEIERHYFAYEVRQEMP